jgi:hypothetical protein
LSKSISLSKRQLIAILLVSIIGSCGLTAISVVAQSATNTFTISSGQYSGAPNYTISVTDGVYYAKNAYGSISYSSTDFATVINECLVSVSAVGGGRIYLTVAEYYLNSQIVIPAILTPKDGQERCIEIVSDRAVIKANASIGAHAIYLDSDTVYHMIKLQGFDVWCGAKDSDYYAIYLKDARVIYIEDVHVGWGGLWLDTCQVVHMVNFEAVDSPNEGLKVNGGGYYWGTNLFIDNCGGNPNIADFNAVLFDGTARLNFNNFLLYGEKGLFGGQETGLYLYNVYSANFDNFQIDGFKSNCIKVEGCHDVTLNNFKLNEATSYSDSHPLEIISAALEDYPSYNIAVSNFNIFVNGAALDAIGLYAQNSQSIYNVAISNGVITGTGDGIVISDDASASCHDITVSNIVVNATGYGVSEGSASNYNIFTGVNARACPSGIYTVGANTKTLGSWNFTSWIP